MASSSRGGGPVIGIDLGTTYSCVAIQKHDKVEIIINEVGSRTTPSCVGFTDEGRLVGQAALNEIILNPHNTIYGVKRLIGRRFRDANVQSDVERWPFKVIPRADGKPLVVVKEKGREVEYVAEQISSMVLARMKEIAETYLGCPVTRAVITVPAYFNDAQRICTKDAGTIAGLDVLRVINEPTAAALAYALDNTVSSGYAMKKIVVVFDLGGGTFDVSVLEIRGGDVQVKATAGDSHLGGEDFTARMVDHLSEQFRRKHSMDIRRDARAMGKLQKACEVAKRNLSFNPIQTIVVDALFEAIDFRTSISRAKFDDLNRDLFNSCIKILEECLADAEVDRRSVDEVILVGGSTRIPMVQELVSGFFGGKRLCMTVNPDEAVAYGAAILAYTLSGGSRRAEDPVCRLTDVNPISLGLDTHAGAMHVFIKRNTTIPTEVEQTWWLTANNVTSLTYKVYEGERSMVKDNNLIGTAKLTGITPGPAYSRKIRYIFEIDDDGILTVSAKDLSSGSKARCTITNEQNRLTRDEINRMVEDAEKRKHEDAKQRRRAGARSELERFAYECQNTIRRPMVASQLRARDKEMLEAEIEETIKWSERHGDDSTVDEYDFNDRKNQVETLWKQFEKKLQL